MDSSHTLKSPARIWTFDGGGPGVASQLIIIKEIMVQIQWMLKLEEAPRPYEYADLMVGTGLGAILVILLARLRLTAEEALGHFIKLGQDVFVEPNISPSSHKFDVERLSTAISNVLRDYGLDENATMIENVVSSGRPYAALTAVPTSDLPSCRLLRTYRAPNGNDDCTILKAILATMALPEWFPPTTIGSTYSKEELISGTIGFNNPTKKALEEAVRVFGSEYQVSIIISLGSGQRRTRGLTNQTTQGLQEALTAMAQDGDSVADDLAQRFSGSSFYHRFSVDSGIELATEIGWGEKELGAIISHTKSYMERSLSSLDTATKVLIENKGSHTLGQLTQVKTKAATTKSIPRLSPYYIARDDVYESMDRHLIRNPGQGQKLFVLYGMGGVGKTQSASFFARVNGNRYKYIFMIDASSVDRIKSDLQSAIRSLGGAHSQDTFEDALQFLTQVDNDDWLVIFDNADDPNLPLATYLPRCEHGTIIITGRNHALAQLAPTSSLQLRGMDESHSIQVLLKAAQRDIAGDEEESKSVTELCRLLGGLPLALVQVGCYCYTAQISFSRYLKRFKTYRSKLMETKPPPQLDEYSYSTYTSINLSYSLLDQSARSLLHLLAFFHPSSICLDIFQIAAKHEFVGNPDWEVLPRDGQYSERLNALRQLLAQNGSWSDVYVDDLLHQLQKFSLVSLSHSNGQTNITIHPLVQSCILDTLSSEDYSLYCYMAVLVLSSCSRASEESLFQHLPAHIAEMESREAGIHPNDAAGFAYIVQGSGNYEESMRRWTKVNEKCRTVNGEEHRSTLYTSYWVANSLVHLAKNEEADMMIRGVVNTQEKVLGEDDENTLISYELLARILSKYETKESENIYRRVLATYESEYGQEDRKTLVIQSSLVSNLLNQKRYSEAESFSKSVLPVMQRALLEDDHVTLRTMNALSIALLEQGKLAEAEDILSDLVARRTRKYGKQHPYTINSLYGIAICRFKRGDLDEAHRILREVLELRERILGKDHSDTIDTRGWLEYVLQAQESLHSTEDQTPNPQNPSPTNPGPILDRSSLKPERNSTTPALTSGSQLEHSSSFKSTKLSTRVKGVWKLQWPQ